MTTNTAPITRLLETDASSANFAVRVAYEWDEQTYVVHASVDAHPNDLLDRIKREFPRDEATRLVHVHMLG